MREAPRTTLGRMVRVLIVDDHEVVRQGLRFMLAQEPGLEVVGEAADGVQALAEIRRCRPDVMLLDLMMPGLDGLGVLHALAGTEPRPAVIVLTSLRDEQRAMEAVRAGALSYLPKTTTADRVTEAIRAAATGGSVLDPGVAAALVQGPSAAPPWAWSSPPSPQPPRRCRAGGRVGWRAHERDGRLGRLSPRERDVLVEVAHGRSNREIARSLALGEQTVKSHVSSILTKLDLQDRTQAAIFGLQHGLVALGEALRGDR
nr:response regulator transcription factor [Dactylosporangium thailandense]